MKKIININFQGRIIPIEETSYDILKNYIDSLRTYFANEEGRDEIMSDIESRIAELFSERLKHTACITDEEVNTVITSIGRPEDFDEAETGGNTSSGNTTKNNNQQQTTSQQQSLYRSKNDKVLAGVCSGLANYFKIDPAIVRLLFALVTFGGFGIGILIYLILWVILPAKTLTPNIRKRLFRNSQEYMLGGVASGLAIYFNIKVWVVRLIFFLPFILGALTYSPFRSWFNFYTYPLTWLTPHHPSFPFGRGFVSGGLGGTLLIIYIILWIILPKARSASEKLEMRGEEVNLESIKNTVKEEQASPKVHRTGRGIGHAIGVLFKAFFLCIAGIIALALITALVAILFGGVAGGVGLLPFKNFILENSWQNLLALGGCILFLGIPGIALLTWLIRRIMGIRSKRHYLGYVFGTLWIIGIISISILVASIVKNFRTKDNVEEDIFLNQPSNSKLYITTEGEDENNYKHKWNFDEGWPLLGEKDDSLFLNTVRFEVVKSNDSIYHVHQLKMANGINKTAARNTASFINIGHTQNDSVLTFSKSFTISNKEKFRNQRIVIVIEVPIGKKIELDKSIYSYDWFSIQFNNNHRRNNWDDEWPGGSRTQPDVEYIMTVDGLRKTQELNSNHPKA